MFEKTLSDLVKGLRSNKRREVGKKFYFFLNMYVCVLVMCVSLYHVCVCLCVCVCVFVCVVLCVCVHTM